MAIYTMLDQKLGATAPGNSGTITASSVLATSLTLNWTKATDAVDPQSSLQYLAYYSTNSILESVSEIKANGTAVGSYTADINTKPVTGLTGGTLYYFNVLVKDTAGNETPYTKLQQATADATAPAAGNSGTITTSNVGGTSVTLNWTKGTDNLTSQANLQYLAYYSLSSTMDSVSDIETNGTAVGSYEADIATKQIDSLTSAMVYYFNVIIKDEAGNKTAYSKKSETTLDLTSPEPGNSGSLSVTNVSGTAMTVSWTKATDNIDPQASLQYLLYYSTNSSMNSVSDIETNGTPFGSYTADIGTNEIIGLTSSTTYYVNVIVKDTTGNKSPYTQASQMTLDETTPVAGSSGVLAPSSIGANTVTISWTKATDNVSLQTALQYRVYYSLSSTMDSISDIETNGTAVDVWQTDIDTRIIESLTSSSTYYFNVIVKDEAGNKAAYAKLEQATLDVTAPTPGNSGVITVANVATTQVDLSWSIGTDDLTAGPDIQYLAYYSTDSNMDDVTSVELNGTPVGSYSMGSISDKTVTGLSPSTQYYFNVLLRDAAGNKAAYSKIAQATVDETAPTVTGSILVPSNVGGYSVTLDWEKATDDFDPQSSLQYRVYYSTSSTMDSVSDIEMNGTAAGDYTTDIMNYQVNGLTSGESYYFNVIVKDLSGNKTAYSKLQQSTVDVVSPVPGNAGLLTPTAVTKTTISLSWATATDNVANANLLDYLVYYSTSSSMNTVSDIEANGTAVDTWATDINAKEITGLTVDTIYYINVIVKDPSGNKSAYTQKMQKTAVDAIIDVTPDLATVTGPITWGNGSTLTLSADGDVTATGDLTLDIADLDQIVASGSNRVIKVATGGSIRVKNKKKFTVLPKTKYRLKIKV